MTKRNSEYSTAIVLSASGTCCYKKTPFCCLHSKKRFQPLCTGSSERKKKGAEIPISGVVAETMKRLANSSYGCQIMNRSRHTVTKYLSDKKTQAAVLSKLLKRADHMNNSLYEVELAKAQIEHKELIIVGFFILEFVKLRTLELYYNFFTRISDVHKIEKLEMDTDSLCSCRERTGRLYKT